jgi:hypothetical protein
MRNTHRTPALFGVLLILVVGSCTSSDRAENKDASAILRAAEDALPDSFDFEVEFAANPPSNTTSEKHEPNGILIAGQGHTTRAHGEEVTALRIRSSADNTAGEVVLDQNGAWRRDEKVGTPRRISGTTVSLFRLSGLTDAEIRGTIKDAGADVYYIGAQNHFSLLPSNARIAAGQESTSGSKNQVLH